MSITVKHPHAILTLWDALVSFNGKEVFFSDETGTDDELTILGAIFGLSLDELQLEIAYLREQYHGPFTK